MDNKKPTRGFPQVGCTDARDSHHYSLKTLPLVIVKEVAHVDSRILAEQFGTPDRMFHITINRLANNACSLAAGQRAALTPQTRLAVASASFIAQKAIESALEAGAGHHDAFLSAKAQVQLYTSGASLLLGA